MKRERELEVAALYLRLSRDDDMEGESNSIANQRKLLKKVAADMGYTKTKVFVDDGFSGTNFERPGFQEMERAIEDGYISAVFVKDMSRLGRDYLKVGFYTDSFFPDNDVRFVAINDGVDSNDGDNEFVPFKNIMNEWYAKDASRKVRMAHKIRGASGEPLSQPPYGYQKDPENRKRWIVDPEPASVIRRIFTMALEGRGIEQIAGELAREKILTPTHYWASKGIGRGGKKIDTEPHCWRHSTISKILATQEYCGDVINFKTFSKSYKQKKRMNTPPGNWMIFEGVHEPIIRREDWQRIQSQRRKVRKRQLVSGEKVNMFTGLLKCAECGSNLHFHFNQGNHDIKYFNCSGYNRTRGICSSTHYIRADFLEQIVLADIRRITRFAKLHEEPFAQLLMQNTMQDAQQMQVARKDNLKDLISRDKELDVLFEKIYEDSTTGKISEERFAKMAKKYEDEQAELSVRIEKLDEEIRQNANKCGTVAEFVKMVRKYSNIRKLTPDVLHQFVDSITVHHAEKVDGKKVQRVEIFYNCVGTIELPQCESIPFPEIEIKTRKGVALSYAPNVKAEQEVARHVG